MIKSLSKMVDKRASYSIAQIVKTLFLVEKEPAGRIELMRELNLKEAPVKTLLKNLRNNKLIKPTTKGNVLTVEGKKFVDRLKKRLSNTVKIGCTGYTLGKYNSAVLVKGAARKVKSGIEQRDEAIKIGATGATTLIQRNGKLIFPGCDVDITSLKKELRKKFKVGDNDVIIISSADTYSKAEEGAIIAALPML